MSPLYDFKCSSCLREVTLLLKITDGKMIQCKECGADLEQVITAPNFTLKSKDGFYGSKPKRPPK